MNAPVYLDYNATTPLKPAARDAMIAAMNVVGNASSIHSFGRAARKRIEDAREQVGKLVGAAPKQVIFNSGATEGNNTILRGFAGTRILISAIEHASVIECGAALNAEKIPVTADGVVDLQALENMLKAGPSVGLVSVMLVNNETGVIQPVADVAKLARAYGAASHCDTVQAAGKIPINIDDLGIDFITLSAHKIGGPQGIGAIVTANGTISCLPTPIFIVGGGQERRLRAGTENVPAIAGFGAAAHAALTDINDYQKLGALRDRIETALVQTSNSIKIYGTNAQRVPNTTAFVVPGVPAETMLMNLDISGIAISSGSACSSGTVKPSHVLAAMGVTPDDAKSGLRVSLGWATTANDVDRFIEVWQNTAKRMLKA